MAWCERVPFCMNLGDAGLVGPRGQAEEHETSGQLAGWSVVSMEFWRQGLMTDAVSIELGDGGVIAFPGVKLHKWRGDCHRPLIGDGIPVRRDRHDPGGGWSQRGFEHAVLHRMALT